MKKKRFFYLRKMGKEKDQEQIEWSKEALESLRRIPEPIRDMARYRLEVFAKKRGYKEITPQVMEERYHRWEEEAGEISFSPDLHWSREAKEKIMRIPPFVRASVIKEVEAYVKKRGMGKIDEKVIEELKEKWEDFDTFHESLLDDPDYQKARKLEKERV